MKYQRTFMTYASHLLIPGIPKSTNFQIPGLVLIFGKTLSLEKQNCGKKGLLAKRQNTMETITVRTRDRHEASRLREILRKAGADIASEKTETLEEKIFRLYEQDHYTDAEMKMFFEIPKEHRVDPFDVIDDGDVYWADRRHVEQLDRDLEAGRRDIEEGRCVELDINNIEESLMAIARGEGRRG